MKIYTKTGDQGTTSLIGGLRVYKDDLRVEVYGAVDELNSIIGVIISYFKKERGKKNLKIENKLMEIQKDLFEIEANLADPKGFLDKKLANNLEKQIQSNERFIDDLTKDLDVLRNFILPSGDLIASFSHLGRTVARRAERLTVTLSKKEDILKENLVYLNRLSDLFFTVARFINSKKGIKEIIWTK